MDRHPPKLQLIFILLALSGFILLITNIISLREPESLQHLNLNHTYCAQFGQKLTAEETKEEIILLNSITWPGPLVQGLPVEFSTNPAMSYFVIQGPTEQHMGGQLVVHVHVQNFLGMPKKHGGDFLIARLHSPELGAGVAGKVHDHQDGNYTVIFPLLWAGVAWVEITMVHPSEAVVVLKRLQEEHPDRVFFKSLFHSGAISETTVCNLCLPLNQQPLCNYTDPATGEPWYCYKPKKLGCDTRINHYKGGYVKNLVTKYEAQFFQSKVNIKIPIKASVMDHVSVLLPENGKTNIKRIYNAAGYYFNNTWIPLSDVDIRQFNDASAITQCLKGKIVYMFGDSTMRQWFEYLTAMVPDLKQLNLYSLKQVGPLMAVDSNNNILLTYRCHGPPIRFTTVFSSELRYIANELDRLKGGPHMVVLISVWSHFSTFPDEIYIRRLRHIRRAVLRLLNRRPDTLVVIRTANLQQIDPEISMYNSDWFSLQKDALLRAMFKGLHVQLLDAWEMTLAHHLPHELHSPHVIIRNMMDMVLSRICPVKKI